GGVSREHREHVTLWWSEFFVGPAAYTEKLGGYHRMVGKHRDLGITTEQRLQFATLMSLAADDAGLPDDPECRTAFRAYHEGGTRQSRHTAGPGTADVPEKVPVPRWGWGVTPPYQPSTA